jgi:hypothetical protein
MGAARGRRNGPGIPARIVDDGPRRLEQGRRLAGDPTRSRDALRTGIRRRYAARMANAGVFGRALLVIRREWEILLLGSGHDPSGPPPEANFIGR